MKSLREQEKAELKAFDEDVVKQWGELIAHQTTEMQELGVPYFGNIQEEDNENRVKMLAFLEDLISGGEM
jgi:hypothetical protein